MSEERDLRTWLMDKAPIIAVVFVLIITMIPQVPAVIKAYLMVFIIVGIFPFIILLEKTAQWNASAYMAIRALIRPMEKEVTFYIKKPVGGVNSRAKVGSPNWYITGPFELAEKVPMRVFGSVEKIEVEHELPWSERVMGTPGWVNYKGMVVEHNNVIRVEFWEIKRQSVRIDFLEPIVRFRMVSAPRDYFITKGVGYNDLPKK